jgi:hypothetical protein
MTMKSSSLFAQIITTTITASDFRSIVSKYEGEKHAKGFTCWHQFVGMVFLQLAKLTSLREIVDGMKGLGGKLSHLRLPSAPKRSSLSYANAHRPSQIYQELFYHLLGRFQTSLHGAKKFRFKNKLLSMDATTIDLCLSLFPWANFRQTKGAVKVHLLLDHDGYFPVFAHITDGKGGDARVCREQVALSEHLPKGSIVVFDRAYVDFSLFRMLNDRGVYFVTRLKEGMNWVVREHRPIPKQGGILRDDVIEFCSTRASVLGQHLFRIVELEDPETGERYVYLTNHMDFGATTIVRIYKDRWQIEIFFKTLKQNLRIKTFVGTSENALKTQIWTALITILLLMWMKKLAAWSWSMSNLVAFLRLSLLTHRDLFDWLNDPFHDAPVVDADQLCIQL